ncbi:MAG: helix-turn-helix transcriptional regulator [Egibacteraceae bacterium]
MESSPFGRGLRHWRRLRGVSQLELATTAATTTRHVSYLETGRSRPSRVMVERLGDALHVPLRERNRLLEMAGLAATYPEGDLAADDLAPFQRVIDRLLHAHEPFPGFVVDRHWNMVEANRAAERFLAGFAERNTVRLVLGPLRPLIENWSDVAAALLERLSADLLRFPDDEVLLELHGETRAALGAAPEQREQRSGRVICPRFRIDGALIRTITVAARFESVADVTLDEVRVELVYPEDETADRFFRDLVDRHPGVAPLGEPPTPTGGRTVQGRASQPGCACHL